MNEVRIVEINIDTPFTVLGHTFQGLREVEAAVEANCRIQKGFLGDRYLSWREPTVKLEGVHVVKLYERYPCFDSSDYAEEDREYCNYYFLSNTPTDAEIFRLAEIKHGCNYRQVSPEMPAFAVPALYYGGWGKKMTLALPV